MEPAPIQILSRAAFDLMLLSAGRHGVASIREQEADPTGAGCVGEHPWRRSSRRDLAGRPRRQARLHGTGRSSEATKSVRFWCKLEKLALWLTASDDGTRLGPGAL